MEAGMNRQNQKERAIALLAGNAFLLAQAITNPNVASFAMDTLVPLFAALDGTRVGVFVGTMSVVTWMLLPIGGLWFSWSALRVANTDSEGLQKICEHRLNWALLPIGWVVALGAVAFFARYAGPALLDEFNR
jgi:hypothetical protein